jgi:hypothetical protein
MLFLILAAGIFAEPAHHIGIKVTPGVTLIPYDAAQFPDLASAIKPYMAGFESDLVVLINDSAKDITAATIAWSYKSISRSGAPSGVTRKFDQYHLPTPTFVALVSAHSKRLLAPAASGFIRFADAQDRKVQIELDSIVFADGEIVGPDLLDIAHDITSRYQAGKLVASRLHMGKLTGKGAAEVGEGLTGDIVHDRGGFNWLQEYQVKLANIGANPENVDAFLNSLDHMVEPPHFHRAQETTK